MSRTSPQILCLTFPHPNTNPIPTISLKALQEAEHNGQKADNGSPWGSVGLLLSCPNLVLVMVYLDSQRDLSLTPLGLAQAVLDQS